MKILSFGAGMQSTALALMACENAVKPLKPYPAVPVYDAVIFCDLGLEPPWVARQVEFTRCACERAGIPFYVLNTPLYKDFMSSFGQRRTVSIPWWTLKEDGHKSKMPRNCTIEYKIEAISRFVRWELLNYRKGQRLRPEDVKGHEMHMGFSAEEKRRCRENPNRLFVNRFPLVEMGLTRADNYKYILEEWDLDTRASACAFCPFHRNYFIGVNAYGSSPEWYIGGDLKNGESKKAGKAFFNTDVDFNIAEYFHFCNRLLRKEPKERGKAPVMLVFCSFQQIQTVIQYGERYGFRHNIPLVFVKNYSPQVLKANMKIVGATEYGLLLYRDKLPKFNNDGRMIFNWFKWERDGPNIPKLHDTQKPVKLLKRLIEIFTDAGDVVIDPCAGSGSTLRAAYELGRHSYGFEVSREYCGKANAYMLNGLCGPELAVQGTQMDLWEV